MKVKELEEIIAEAKHGPLASVFPQALWLAHNAGAQALELWLRLELGGYVDSNEAMTDDVTVPEYRTVAGTWHDEYGRPLILNDPDLAFVNEIPFRSAISEVESLADARGILAQPYPELSAVILDVLNVRVSTFRFSPQQLKPVLHRVRSELLQRLVAQREDTPASPGGCASAPTQEEILELHPNIYGVGINVKALYRRWRGPG